MAVFVRITNGFAEMSDADLSAKIQNILESLTGNIHYPNPTPTLLTVQAKLDQFRTLMNPTGTAEKAARDQKRQELIDLIHATSRFVLFTADNNFTIAASSGFTIARRGQPQPPVSKAANQKLADGQNAGELLLIFDRVPGARSYQYQYTEDPVTENSVWKTETGTTRKNLFTGLQSRKKYWVRVGAVGNNKQLVYSDPVSRVVQ